MTNWPTRTLGELCSVVDLRAMVGASPYVEIGNVDPITKKYSFSDKPAVKGALLAEAGDVIVSRVRPNRGAITLLREKQLALSAAFTILRARHEMTGAFLFYALAWNTEFLAYLDRHSKGGLYPTVSERDILAFAIPVPSPIERERIVQILDEADTLRGLRAQADERTRNLAAAIFDEVFGDPVSNPRGWNTTTLGGLGTVVTGNTPPRSDTSFYGDFIEWVKTDNIDASRGKIEVSAERLSETGAVRGRIVPEGGVLITCIAGSIERIGDAAITDRKVAINQQINAIIPNEGVESDFLGSLVRAMKPFIQARATGVMTRIISKSALESICVISPPPQLQRAFAARVAEVHKLEAAQAVCRTRMNDLFMSLLHHASEGKL